MCYLKRIGIPRNLQTRRYIMSLENLTLSIVCQIGLLDVGPNVSHIKTVGLRSVCWFCLWKSLF